MSASQESFEKWTGRLREICAIKDKEQRESKFKSALKEMSNEDGSLVIPDRQPLTLQQFDWVPGWFAAYVFPLVEPVRSAVLMKEDK